MRIPRSFLAGLSVAVIAGAAGADLLSACANPDTQTPTCTNNVTVNGITQSANGCDQFATCPLGAAANCCVADGGVPFTGSDLATCLYGYGDPSCPYLSVTNVAGSDGIDMVYTCTTSPPDGGSGTGGTGGTGGGGVGGGASSASTSSGSASSSTSSSSSSTSTSTSGSSSSGTTDGGSDGG